MTVMIKLMLNYAASAEIGIQASGLTHICFLRLTYKSKSNCEFTRDDQGKHQEFVGPIPLPFVD